MEKAMILVNPKAGDQQGEELVPLLKNILEDKNLASLVYIAKSGEELIKGAEEACEKGLSYLFVLGGDGTVKDALAGLKKYKYRPCLGIIPLGTGNLLASSLGIEGDPENIIRNLDLDSKSFLDVGQAGESIFSYVFSIGELSRAIHSTKDQDKKQWGMMAYGREVLSSGLDFPAYNLQVDLDGQTIQGEFTHLLLSHRKDFKGFSLASLSEKPRDKVFHLFLLKPMTGGQMMGLALDAFRKKAQDNDRVLYYQGKKLGISCLDEEMPPTDLDGDKGPSLPLSIELLPEFVQVLCPQ